MVMHGNTWQYMVIHGVTWYYMLIHGNTWRYMVIHGDRRRQMAIPGDTWRYTCMEIHGNTCNTWICGDTRSYIGEFNYDTLK